jgi:competence protein ComEA
VERTLFQKSLACFLLCCAALAAAPACVKLSRRHAARAEPQAHLVTPPHAAPRTNLNQATLEELERLPGIGPGLAARIVEHRERHGPFRRVEHLLAVRGISERRFRGLRHLVTVE